jgi:hypothetical protein
MEKEKGRERGERRGERREETHRQTEKEKAMFVPFIKYELLKETADLPTNESNSTIFITTIETLKAFPLSFLV